MREYYLQIRYPERTCDSDHDIVSFKFTEMITPSRFRDACDDAVKRLDGKEFGWREERAEAIVEDVCEKLGGTWDYIGINYSIDVWNN